MPNYYEFEVSLPEIQPRIWRRFLLRTTSTFAQLHQAIQQSFGWQDCHLWTFRLPTYAGRTIAAPRTGVEADRPEPDAKIAKLNSYFTGKGIVEWCEYVYDFGDEWIHEVKLIGLRTEQETFKRRLLDGQFSGPPEDCGGPPGYDRIAHFIATGEDIHGDDPEELKDWLGDWHPDAFDVHKAKAKFDA